MSYYLENRSVTGGNTGGVEHSKFYRIEERGNEVVFTWGPTGAPGQSKVELVSDDPAIRKACMEKQLKAKQKRGYVVIQAGGQTVEARPSAEGRNWGLELEVHSNVDVAEIVAGMRSRGLEVNVETGRYFKSNGQKWDVKRDGSCGLEWASPILSGEAGLFAAKVAVEKIREVCPTAVNHQCGIHVTVGIEDFDYVAVKRLAIGYLKAQEHFYAECAEWRQDNQYCRRNNIHALNSIIASRNISHTLNALNASDRYQGLNWARYTERKIVEFRMMESSVAIRKVGAWIRMCVGFVDGMKMGKVKFNTSKPFLAETFKSVCDSAWRV